ncbi:PREDICTED: phosphoinositide-3-kinase-interacting protein 1 [Gekko japonicus]|uniref:Phosphoinositide-3-kinase-interacting protein 1 n=1 Tax=Gekko japonicus TaxID=146911 RepID=A0ABM1LGH7_GEKJA|nr:PREDICTED: phosphoinositide-3-kinase-interacting protein 1 [Gekko japonicus]
MEYSLQACVVSPCVQHASEKPHSNACLSSASNTSDRLRPSLEAPFCRQASLPSLLRTQQASAKASRLQPQQLRAEEVELQFFKKTSLVYCKRETSRTEPGPRRRAALAMEPSWARALLVSCWALLALASAAEDVTSSVLPAVTAKTMDAAEGDHIFESANSLPSRSEAAAVQPVVGISQRVKMRSNEKKDLGTLGYVMGLIMMVIIIAIGTGIVVGYIYKRGKDLKQQHEQKAYEREMQRITLPLSAFTNQACELVDENTVVVHTTQTPVEEMHNGDAPLMGQAGTPGA